MNKLNSPYIEILYYCPVQTFPSFIPPAIVDIDPFL